MLCWASFAYARILLDKSSTIVDVLHYGAVGDGKTDDSKAFLEAWKQTCQMATQISGLTIPAGKTFLLNPLTFQGPCKPSKIDLQIFGNIVAPSNTKLDIDRWITFDSINGLAISGTGKIDGQGPSWWQCRNNKQCSEAPTALLINNCNDLKLSGIHFIDSPKMHIVLNACTKVKIHNINITAPEDSPNTDGIHIGASETVDVWDSNIGTGDDCISIGTNSSAIKISGIVCGPGHGISVGSLGHSESFAAVENVHVYNCTFRGTMNGARIKTWQGGSGYATGIKYEKIIMDSVDNPILIDQYYCGGSHNCPNKTSAVKVSYVSFHGVHGTSTNEFPINLSCSETVGCTNLLVSDVDLWSTEKGKEVASKYINAHGNSIGHVFPSVPCLSNSL